MSVSISSYSSPPGVVNTQTLLRLLAQGVTKKSEPVAVRDIMMANPTTVTPSTPTLEAIATMRDEKVDCLPVVQGGKLLGMDQCPFVLSHLIELHCQHVEYLPVVRMLPNHGLPHFECTLPPSDGIQRDAIDITEPRIFRT